MAIEVVVKVVRVVAAVVLVVAADGVVVSNSNEPNTCLTNGGTTASASKPSLLSINKSYLHLPLVSVSRITSC